MNRTEYHREYARKRRATPEGLAQNRAASLSWRRNNARTVLLKTAKARAKKRGQAFSVTEADIIWVTHCPVFGTKLIYGGDRHDLRNVASLDRLDNTLGYVPGNVFVLSWRANAIKNDASAEELRTVADWIDIKLPKQ